MITLRTLQLFFRRLSYEWKGEILNKNEGTVVKATSFDEISKPKSDITTFRLYRGRKKGDVAMSISEKEMKHYDIQTVQKLGKIYNLQNDLTKQWKSFLKEKEKHTGLDFEFLTKKDWKHFIENISCYIPNNINKTKYTIQVNTNIPQNASIRMDSLDGDAVWCIDLAENNISLYVKRNEDIIKITSNYIEREWEKFVSLTSDRIFATIETEK